MSTTFAGRDGLPLAADVWGDPDDAPLLLVHGGGQTRHAWKGAGKRLAEEGFHVVAYDQRGHGDSAWAGDGDYELDAFVDDLVAVASTFDRPPALVGASLGGVASMLAIGERSQSATSLVLVDVAPKLDPRGVAEIRAFMRAHPDGFSNIDEAADAVARFLPHRPRPADASGLMRNLRLRDDGRYRWHWDPAYVRERATTADRVPDRLASAASSVRVPTLLVRGALSRVVGTESVAHLRQTIPHATFVDIQGADHMVAGDRNDAFAEAAVSFLHSVRHSRPSALGFRQSGGD